VRLEEQDAELVRESGSDVATIDRGIAVSASRGREVCLPSLWTPGFGCGRSQCNGFDRILFLDIFVGRHHSAISRGTNTQAGRHDHTAP
jgi:hypothetical protein